jgi:microcystin-dependent protein
VTRHAWLTPDEIPAERVCRYLKVPDGVPWEAAFRGALLLLAEAFNWEQQGTLTPQEVADEWADVFYRYVSDEENEECSSSEGAYTLQIGDVFYSANPNPPNRCLACDGSQVEQATYPDLYALIGDTFGEADEGYFRLPDMQGRSPLGIGPGGEHMYTMGEQAGEYYHQLDITEMPRHYHDIGLYITSGGSVRHAQGVLLTTFSANQASGYSGTDQAHNTVHPVLCLAPYIVATDEG